MNLYKNLKLYMVILFLIVCLPIYSEVTPESLEQALIAARESLPPIYLEYEAIRTVPNKFSLILGIGNGLLEKKELSIEAKDNIIKWMNHSGDTRSDVIQAKTWLCGDLKRVSESAEPGEYRYSRYQNTVIYDGLNFVQFVPLDNVLTLKDPVPGDRFNVDDFDHIYFDPSIFGFKPGELIKKGAHVDSIQWIVGNNIKFTLSKQNKQIGQFIVDMSKGFIATHAQFQVMSLNVVDFICGGITLIENGNFYFPNNATVLNRIIENYSFEDDFVTERSSKDAKVSVLIKSIEVLNDDILDNLFRIEIQEPTYVQDFRTKSVNSAKKGDQSQSDISNDSVNVVEGFVQEGFKY